MHADLPSPGVLLPDRFHLGPALSPAQGQAGASAWRAIALHRSGDLERAGRAAATAIAAQSRHASTWSNLAAFALLDATPSLAERHARLALDLDASCAAAQINLALADLARGDPSSARQGLNRILAQEPDHALARTLLGTILLAGRDFDSADAALATAEASAPGHWRVALERGRVARSLGRMEQVRGFALDSVRRAAQALPRPLPAPLPALKAAGKASPQALQQALCTAQDLLDAASIPFYLMAGTLLGLVRDGRLLAGDKDIDLALPDDCPRQRAAAVFAAHRDFDVPAFAGDPGPLGAFGVLHRPSQRTIDLFFARHDEEGVSTRFGRPPHYIGARVRPFHLGQLRWSGRNWTIPSPPEQYLEDLYGPGWRRPDPHFDTILSNPSRTPETLPLAIDLGLLRLGEALELHDWPRARSLCRQVLARQTLAEVQALDAALAERMGPGPP